MSSGERTYLLKGRPYEVSRALRVLSQYLQAGSMLGEGLWVRVPPERVGLLQEVLWAYGSLHMGEPRDGVPYRDWTKEKKNGQEGSIQGDQETPIVAQKPAAQIVRLSSPEGSFFQPARDIQIGTASPVFHFRETDPTGITPPSGIRPPPLEIISVPLWISTGTHNGGSEKPAERQRDGRRVSRRPPDAEFLRLLEELGPVGVARRCGVNRETVIYLWVRQVPGANALLPPRKRGRPFRKIEASIPEPLAGTVIKSQEQQTPVPQEASVTP